MIKFTSFSSVPAGYDSLFDFVQEEENQIERHTPSRELESLPVLSQKALLCFEEVRSYEHEISDIRGRIKECYRYAKERGCDVDAIKEMLRRARKDRNVIDIIDSNLEEYEGALSETGFFIRNDEDRLLDE